MVAVSATIADRMDTEKRKKMERYISLFLGATGCSEANPPAM